MGATDDGSGEWIADNLADVFTEVNGQQVLTYPVPADWKSLQKYEVHHNQPYGVFYETDQSRTATFVLVKEERASGQREVLEYLKRNNPDYHTVTGSGVDALNGVYDFVRTGTDVKDPLYHIVDEGIYWLVETDSPEGFFAGGKPIRIRVSQDLRDKTRSMVVYAGDEDTNSAEYRAYEYYILKGNTDSSLIGYEANGNTGAAFGYRNYELYSLPASGGRGTYLFTVMGSMFLALGAGYVWLLKKRKEEAV